MSNEKKIGIIVLMKYRDYYALSPEKEAEVMKGWRELEKRWGEKVKWVRGYYSLGMGKFDGLQVWEVNDIGDWEAINEENMRSWGKYVEHYEFYTGINYAYFEEATKEIPHFIQSFLSRADSNQSTACGD